MKGSAAYNQFSTSIIISIVKDGRIPDGVKCEAFLDGKRLPGGDKSDFPEPPEGKLSIWESDQPLYSHVRRWRSSRDGCAAQYQGNGAFRGWQTMQAQHVTLCVKIVAK